jgi:hypothetical protein
MPSNLTLESLEEALRALGEKPILQAIAIYDCEQTREHVISLGYKAPFENVVLTFMESAGPVVRWFFQQQPLKFLWDEVDEYDLAPRFLPAPINRYGFALVMSQKSFAAWTTTIRSEKADTLSILLPRVYDLNKKEPQDAS